MAAPDMPLVNLTLEQYCNRGTALAADVNNLAPFVHYMLSGVDDGQLVVVDPILNGVTADDQIEVARDYDSALGFHTSIQIKNSISVKPVAQTMDTLTSNVHLNYLFRNSRVSTLIHHDLKTTILTSFRTLLGSVFPFTRCPISV